MLDADAANSPNLRNIMSSVFLVPAFQNTPSIEHRSSIQYPASRIHYPMYLNSHSYYSLRYGTMPIEKLVAAARRNNVRAMALTDINNSTGMMDFISECRLNGIKPIAGMEFRDENNRLLYVVVARNNEGFREINEFLTRHNLEKLPLPPRAPAFDHAYTIYPLTGSTPVKPLENEFIGIRPGRYQPPGIFAVPLSRAETAGPVAGNL